MFLSKDSEQSSFQAFKTKDGRPLQQLPSQICPETGSECIFWQNVQNTFHDVDYLEHGLRIKLSPILFMVDQHGEVLLPLRIKYSHFDYIVVYREHQGKLSLAMEFPYIYRSWKEASRNAEVSASKGRQAFLEVFGNAGYHHSKLLMHLECMWKIGVKAEVDEKTEDQLLDEIQEHLEQMPKSDYQNACFNSLGGSNFPAPCRFLVLPEDLRSWNDSDPTTHNFRLYFLCDVIDDKDHTSNGPQQSTLPRHKHLSNHSGYSLSRPQDFFQKYGSHTLLMLKMAKYGATHGTSTIPPLTTLKILWSLDPNLTDNHLTKNTIGPLIDKSISYLEALSVPKYRSEGWLTSREITTIKNYLIVSEDSNPLGGLHPRSVSGRYWYWTCQQHGRHMLTPGKYDALVDFIQGCNGHFNLQLASLRVHLQSMHQADQLFTLLPITGQLTDISIKLWWNVSRQDVKYLLQKISVLDVCYTELHGITRQIHPKGHIKYRADLFDDFTSSVMMSRSMTLLNYPRPNEQYTYFRSMWSANFRIHWKQQQPVVVRSWGSNLESLANEFLRAIVDNGGKTHLQALQQLQGLLATLDCQAASTMSLSQGGWCGEFDMEEGSLRDLQLFELGGLELPVTLKALKSLRTLTLDVDRLIDQDITSIVQASPQLQELIISLQESRALERVERSFEMWQDRSSPFQMTLLERDNDGRGHVIVQVVVGDRANSHPGISNTDLQGRNARSTSSQECRQGVPALINFLQWHSGHVAMPRTDLTASLLDRATESHPSVLTAFLLDTSLLSHKVISHVQNILQRSKLRQLHIVCTALDPNLADFNKKVLLAAQWSTLQSLIVSGVVVNEWIEIWANFTSDKKTNISALMIDLQLQGFRIQGSGKQPICLSHSSVLFVHQLVYLNPSMELVLENVFLQDRRDLDLVAASICS